MGVCTGLISSAAVSVSSNIGELLPVAVQAVVLALRLGLCASRVRRLLGPKESVHGNWSVLVSGYSEAEAAKLIENFTLYHVRPLNLLNRIVQLRD